MKFKFDKNLEHQVQAIDSVVKVFETGKNIFGHQVVKERKEEKLFDEIRVVKNNLEFDEKRVLQNIKSIQKQNKISGALDELDLSNFSVEMETGTGKTYVYLRTIFELNRVYDLRKFIILVPSVAIREGVMKTLRQTKIHFKNLYGVGYNFFEYDSQKLFRVREFSQGLDVQIMIMTIQSFNKDKNVMRQTPDRFGGESPLEMVAMTNPVVIMDEPQNMESELSRSAIKDLKPIFKLRYSATHKKKHNLMYCLSPVEAYCSGLVKKIEVYGVDDSASSDFIFNLKEIKIERNRSPKVTVGLEVKVASGEFLVKDFKLSAGADLARRTQNDNYREVYINEVNARDGQVELSNGKIYKLGESKKENREAVFRSQISETIKRHFKKQEKLGDKVKVLSLFFIDKVENYTSDNGIIKRVFQEEFEKLKMNSEFFKNKKVENVHNGYFANVKKKGEIIYKNTTGKTLADKEVYDLIMKNKEKLLSFDEDIAFIFSHSALREGWDNPNVFQICTLNESNSQMKKRQEIGRGLRLAVDVDGNRIFDPKVNMLTVVPNESYREFVGSLQTEYREDGHKEAIEPSNARDKICVEFKYRKNVLPEDFKNLWDKIKKKTKFNIEISTQAFVQKAVKGIDEEIDINRLVVRVEKVFIDFEDGGRLKTIFEGDSIGERLEANIGLENILQRICIETGITKKTAFEIISKISNLGLIFENPEEYLRSLILIIKNSLNDLLINEGLKYHQTEDAWELSLFESFEVSENRSLASEKSAYERVVFDSDGERVFAESLEKSERVKFFVKLPAKFVVDTPLGTYNPDWAIVMKTEDGEKLYLIRETKFDVSFEELRRSEKQKILCGKKHFGAIGVDFKVSEEKDLSDLI